MSWSPPVQSPQPGETFAGEYEILSRLGEGAMGTIYLARSPRQDEPIAIKVLNPELYPEEDIVERFMREMRTTAAVQHEHSVRVLDYGTARTGHVYLAMEHLEGQTLDEFILFDAPLTPDRVAHIGVQIASALQAAHGQGIIHRDLKPENIIRLHGAADRVKVFDFGLSLVVDASSSRLTQTGSRLGTPLFMAPEYLQDGTCSARSDLYSLGGVLFELATGEAPFSGPPYVVMAAKLRSPAPSVEDVAPARHPGWLSHLIDALLATDPEDRPESAADVADALAQTQTG